MTNENARNRPRYPLDRRCVRMLADDEVTPETLVRDSADERSDAFRAALKDDITASKNPFGSAFRRNRRNDEII